MNASFALLLAVAGAYVAAHFAFDWLARRFTIVSGAEYLLLGILLGPLVSGVLSTDVIDSLAPILTLALGWIGTIIGTQFKLDALVRTPARYFRIGFAESACTLLVVAGVEFVAFQQHFLAPTPAALVGATALGCMAVASSGAGIALVTAESPDEESLVRQLQLSSVINALVAIAGFGILLAVHHVPSGAGRPLTATEWAVISIAIGVVGGTLFHVFLGETPDPDRLFVALVGGIVIVSGAATYLRLSPLLSALFFGAILVNTTSDPERLTGALLRVERPFYFVLLLFGGAAWQPSQRAWAFPVILFLTARAAGKIGGGRLAARMNGVLADYGRHWGSALLGQGRVVLALGLSYLRQDDLPYRNTIFTAAVASILLTEFFSARMTRAVLRARPAPSRESTAPMTHHAMAD